MTQRSQVEFALAKFREHWPPNCRLAEQRDKNLQALADLNLTADQRKEIILHLKVENYVSGPLEDKGKGGGSIWIFGKFIEDIEVYIKLSLFGAGGKLYAKCISFHPADQPLTYPFSKGGETNDQEFSC